MHNEQIDWLARGAYHTALKDWSYRIARPDTVVSKPTPDEVSSDIVAAPAVFSRTVINTTVPTASSPSSTTSTPDMLSAADMSRYLALFGKMRDLERPAEDGEDWVEDGALTSARRLLGGMMTAKWSPPPRMTWQVPEALVFYWAMGDILFALTVTEGEMGYVERRGSKIAKREHSIPVDENSLTCFI